MPMPLVIGLDARFASKSPLMCLLLISGKWALANKVTVEDRTGALC